MAEVAEEVDRHHGTGEDTLGQKARMPGADRRTEMLDQIPAALGPGTIAGNGSLYRALLATAQTGGAISVVDSLSPASSGPPRHVHRAEDKTFIALSGEATFWLEGKTFTRGPGAGVFLARGQEHMFRVAGSLPCRHLVILTPGGFEGFFADIAAGQLRIPDDMPSILENAARNCLTFTGPPLAG